MNRVDRLESRIGHAYLAMVVALCAWVVWSAHSNHVEYSDGYITIANSQYFLGISTEYFGQRGPFLAFWLTPAEYISELYRLSPLDVNLHHLSAAILHIAYIVIVMRVLNMQKSGIGLKLIAFLSAITSYVFFSYSPFISHDLFPGAIFLLMLVIANRFYYKPDSKLALLLFALGYMAAITKHVYGLFWIAILFVYLVVSLKTRDKTPVFTKWLYLVALSLCSGLLAWITYSVVLYGSIPDVPFLLRPYYQMHAVGDAYSPENPSDLFSAWLYVRNFPYGYGLTTSLLLIPGLVISLRSRSVLQNSFAISWLLSVIAMQFIVFKEVRYLAFLAPLSAVIVLPALRYLWFYAKSKKLYRFILVILLLMDFVRLYPEIWHVSDRLYQGNEISDQLSYLDRYPDKDVYLTNPLSFTSGYGFSPLAGDRYHRLYHITGEIIQRLYHERTGSITELPDFSEINKLQAGDLLHFSSNVLVRLPGQHYPLNDLAESIVQFPLEAKNFSKYDLAGSAYLRFEYDSVTGNFSWASETVPRDQLTFIRYDY